MQYLHVPAHDPGGCLHVSSSDHLRSSEIGLGAATARSLRLEGTCYIEPMRIACHQDMRFHMYIGLVILAHVHGH